MEIFHDGELEEEMRKRDFQANNLSAVWQLFSSSYQEAIQSLTSPVRAVYMLDELGPTRLTLDPESSIFPDSHPEISIDETKQAPSVPLDILREDLQLRNIRGQTLECSFWHPISGSLSSDTLPPCIVYLHGMSSSRKECLYLRDRVLARGFSLFAFDFSGSGLSEGDVMSFGHFEKDDLRAVIEFLFATNKTSRVALWGRCIGGATALLYLCESLDFEYKRLCLTPHDARKLDLGQSKTTNDILCVRPGRVFPFRLTQLNVNNGDMVVLSINGRMVKGLDIESCRNLLTDKQNTDTVEVCGYVRRGSSATTAALGTGTTSQGRSSTMDSDDRPFVFAMTLDSTYGDMDQVIGDMLVEISKSAEKRAVSVPAAMISSAAKIISHSVRKTAGFSFRDIDIVDKLHALSAIPCQFVSASKVDFIQPKHTRAVFDAYGGAKHWLPFDGIHDQNRPDHVINTVLHHFES